MFGKIRKTIKYSAYFIVVLTMILIYANNKSELDNYGEDLWQTFKNAIAKFAVIPEYTPKQVQKQETTVQKPQEKPAEITLPKASIEYTVLHENNGKKIIYGYDKNFNLAAFTDGKKQAILEYTQDGNLEKITAGERAIKFNYNQRGQLTKIEDDGRVVQLRYDLNGFLKLYESAHDKLAFQFDALGKLMTYKRGEGYETKFTYNKEKLDSFVKDGTVTKITFGAKNLVKGIVTDDSYLVINYGKDDLLSYLAGAKYGLAETISYNTNDESIVSSTDNSIFTGKPETARITALNLHLSCAKFKKLPVLFDPVAYLLYTNYFKEDIVSYFVNNFVCDVVYGRSV